MKKSLKILLAAVSALCAVFCFLLFAMFYKIPYVSDYILEFTDYFIWLYDIIAGFCVFLSFIFLISMLFCIIVPIKQNSLTFSKAGGKLRISRQTIESTVKCVFLDIAEVEQSWVRVSLGKKPDKTRVYVRISVNDYLSLSELTEKIKEKIIVSLKNSLDIEVKSIEINIAESGTNEKQDKERVRGLE